MAKPSSTNTNPPGMTVKENGEIAWDLSELEELTIGNGKKPQAYVFTDEQEDIDTVADGLNVPEVPGGPLDFGAIDYVFVATNGKDNLVDASNVSTNTDLFEPAEVPETPNGLIVTGNGKDNILGGAGNDIILAGNGKDMIDGGDGVRDDGR